MILSKAFLLLLLAGAVGFAQSLRFGIEGGVPLTGAFNAKPLNAVPAPSPGAIGYSAGTNRYTFGATAELGLPFHLAVKADVLYKRLGYDSITTAPITTSHTTSNSWEFPLLAKYSFNSVGPLRPYVDGGIAFRHLQGVSQTTTGACLQCVTPLASTTDHPAELSHSFTKGVALGLGLEFAAPLVHVFGEIRYTRWTQEAFTAPAGGLDSTKNQADFLVGVTF